MALPWSRYHTHAAGQVLGASPFNAVQDYCAMFFAGRRRPQTLQLPVWGQRGGWAHNGTNAYVEASGAAQGHIWPIHLPVGASIASAYLAYNRAGGTAIAFRLRRQPHGSGAPITVATVNLSNTASSWWYEPLTLGHIVVAASSYWLEAVSGQTGDRIQHCELNYSRP